MKKLLMIGMTLFLMSSCIEHAHIYLKLTDEDAAVIPYQMGQTVDFVDQNGDTLTYQVAFDDTYPYDQDRYFNRLHTGTRKIPKDDYYCYARTVILDCEQTGASLGFTIRPGKELTFYFGNEIDLSGSIWSTRPCTVNGIEYENVHHQILYSQYTGELIYDWYYNEEYGLLRIQCYDKSLTRVP